MQSASIPVKGALTYNVYVTFRRPSSKSPADLRVGNVRPIMKFTYSQFQVSWGQNCKGSSKLEGGVYSKEMWVAEKVTGYSYLPVRKSL